MDKRVLVRIVAWGMLGLWLVVEGMYMQGSLIAYIVLVEGSKARLARIVREQKEVIELQRKSLARK